MKYFIAIHIGAGYHSKKLEKTYKSLIDRILNNTVEIINSSDRNNSSNSDSNNIRYNDALSICELVISQLEDDPLTNAGRGSSLNADGEVECDASIMDGQYICRCHSYYDDGSKQSCFTQSDDKQYTVYSSNGGDDNENRRCGGGLWAGVGAVNGVVNPIRVATALVKKQQQSLTKSLGRIRPMMLVAEGAKEWAANNNIETYQKNSLLGDPLVTQQSNITYLNHNSRLDLYRQTKSGIIEDHDDQYHQDYNQEEEEENSFEDQEADDQSMFYDTVGAIVVDSNGNIAAGVSSGGISLKHKGRVGEAALFGSGCWAQNELSIKSTNIGNERVIPGVGCSSTGVGEHIMRSMLSKQCCQRIVEHNYADIAVKSYFEQEFLNHLDCFGYQSHLYKKEKSKTTDQSNSKNENEEEEEEEEEEEYSFSNFNKYGDERLSGVIAIRKITNQETKKMEIELVWAHSTYSMGVGYISSKDNFKPHSIISRINENSPVGRCVELSSVQINL